MKTVTVHLQGRSEARRALTLVQAARRHGLKVTGKASRRNIALTLPTEALDMPLICDAFCTGPDANPCENRRAINRINSLVRAR